MPRHHFGIQVHFSCDREERKSFCQGTCLTQTTRLFPVNYWSTKLLLDPGASVRRLSTISSVDLLLVLLQDTLSIQFLRRGSKTLFDR